MNNPILVSSFIAVGLGGMAWFFGPSFSSEEVRPEPVSYQGSAKQHNASTTVTAKATKVDSKPETFVWEDVEKKAVGTDMLKELGVATSPTKAKNTKPTEKSGLVKAKPTATEQPKVSFADTSDQPKVSSTKSESFVSTVEDDLSDFFGSSKANKESAAKTKPAPPVRVARNPEPVVQPKPVVKESPIVVVEPTEKVKEMVVVTPPTDDAPEFSSWDTATEEPKLSAAPSLPTAPTMASKETEINGTLAPVGSMEKKPEALVTKVRISNPVETGLTVTFLVNGKKISLKPQQSYVIRKAPEVNIKFNRGGTFGVAVQSLKDGEYRFSVSREQGWKLGE